MFVNTKGVITLTLGGGGGINRGFRYNIPRPANYGLLKQEKEEGSTTASAITKTEASHTNSARNKE